MLNKTLKVVSTTAIGIILIVITIAVFFLGTESPLETLDWLALSFILISEMALFGFFICFALMVHSSNKCIIRTGILSTLSIYLVVSVLLAIFRNAFFENQNAFVMINLILICIVAIICILLNFVASQVRSIDSKTSNSMLFLQDIERSLFTLKSNPEYTNFEQGLSTLYEKVHFSDKLGNSSYDKALSDEVDNLKLVLSNNSEDRKERVDMAVSQILFFLKQRDTELLQRKRGGF